MIHKKYLRNVFVAASAAAMVLLGQTAMAQLATAQTSAKVTIAKGVSPATLRRALTEKLQLEAVSNLMTAYGVKLDDKSTPKLPKLVDMLSDSIQISISPPDGEVLAGKASISVPSETLRKYLANLEIGVNDLQAKSVKVLVSIDEYLGVATTLDASKPQETTINYSHDKSSFSDTSRAEKSANSSASAFSSAQKNDVAMSSKESIAVSGKQSSSLSAEQSAAASSKGSIAGSGRNDGGSYSGSASASASASAKARVDASQSSQFSGAASSSAALVDKSSSSTARSSSASSSSSVEQMNVQKQNDVVNYSVSVKMASFDNAKPLDAEGGYIRTKLAGVFDRNGLVLVPENDLRAEGGRILSVNELEKNGRIKDIYQRMKDKRIVADVWATGKANYTINGTTATGTSCTGTLDVTAGFIDGSGTLFADALKSTAVGLNDQDCRGALADALAAQLGGRLSQTAAEKLNAKQSRGAVVEVVLASVNEMKRGSRTQFSKALESALAANGQMTDGVSEAKYVTWNVQYKGDLSKVLDNVLESLNWADADYVSSSGRMCVGLEGKGACAEFK